MNQTPPSGDHAALADLLERLTAVPGIAAHEQQVADLIRTLWEPFVDEIRTDALGSVIALRKGTGAGRRATLLAAAHMDQIGFMVREITDEGFLRLTPVGGWDRRILQAQELTVHGRRPLTGVVGSKPPHLSSPQDREKVPQIDDLFVDVGLPADLVRQLAPVGTPVTPRHRFLRLRNGQCASPAMDDRASLAAITMALQELQGQSISADFYAVATVQEETALLGAATAAYAVRPDVAIALDVSFGSHPGAEEGATPLGSGPSILVGPNAHPHVSGRLRQLAREMEMPHEIEVEPRSSGTDAWYMQIAGDGVATGVIGIPLRYMHNPVETLSLSDVAAAGRLLARFAASLNETFAEGLRR